MPCLSDRNSSTSSPLSFSVPRLRMLVGEPYAGGSRVLSIQQSVFSHPIAPDRPHFSLIVMLANRAGGERLRTEKYKT